MTKELSEERKSQKRRRIFIFAIYFIMLAFFISKMLFYANYVGRFPDEIEHISYIAYLEKTDKIIPDFKQMTILGPKTSVEKGYDSPTGTYTFGSALNYLGHPPLYYQVMRLSGGVKIENGKVEVNIMRLRVFSMMLAALAMLLIFYLGFSRIGKQPLFHLLYAAICVSLPMLAFVSGGVNNDTMSLIGFSVFVFGLLRFSEKKRNRGTYFLISAGVFISFLSKMTAGTIVALSLFIYLFFLLIKEKNLRFLLTKKILFSLPVYFLTASYFIIVYLQTGSIQPTFRLLDPRGFYSSGFYISPENRLPMNVFQYINFFYYKFMSSWTGILSHVALIKNGNVFSFDKIGLFLLLLLPLLLIFIIIKHKQKNMVAFAFLSVYLSSCITVITQFLRSYYEYANVSGYLGGAQARYYLCSVASLALAVIYIVKDFSSFPVLPQKMRDRIKVNVFLEQKAKRIALNTFCILFSALLVYEDFIYFVLHFKDYLLK